MTGEWLPNDLDTKETRFEAVTEIAVFCVCILCNFAETMHSRSRFKPGVSNPGLVGLHLINTVLVGITGHAAVTALYTVMHSPASRCKHYYQAGACSDVDQFNSWLAWIMALIGVTVIIIVGEFCHKNWAKIRRQRTMRHRALLVYPVLVCFFLARSLLKPLSSPKAFALSPTEKSASVCYPCGYAAAGFLTLGATLWIFLLGMDVAITVVSIREACDLDKYQADTDRERVFSSAVRGKGSFV